MGSFEKRVEKFIVELAKEPVDSLTTKNQYSFDDKNNEVRRQNLQRYLVDMRAFNPKVLLLSEAPGYKGARLTGVPFTGRRQILNGVRRWLMFGEKKGYGTTKEWEDIKSEASATIVWNVLEDAKQLPLMWPSYPFHPHKKGADRSNRTPSEEEVAVGQKFLRELVDIFDIKEIVAVGRVAQRNLKSCGVEECVLVRHPANGGAVEFRKGLLDVLKK